MASPRPQLTVGSQQLSVSIHFKSTVALSTYVLRTARVSHAAFYKQLSERPSGSGDTDTLRASFPRIITSR
jgi:hypothetical protein